MSDGGFLYLTKKVTFSAAHRLYRDDWSDEENRRVFGKCARPGGHGHNYVLEVTLRGRPDPETGMVLDLKEMKEIIHREFWEKCDHHDFNRDVALLKGRIPTAENIVMAAWEVLEPVFPHGMLFRLRLHETDRNAVEYFGPARSDGMPDDAAAPGSETADKTPGEFAAGETTKED